MTTLRCGDMLARPAIFRAWLKKWSVQWRCNAVRGVDVGRNAALRSSLGRWNRGKNRIELSDAALADRRRRKEILCHEAAHAALDLMGKRALRPHGPEWQGLVRAAGFEPKASLVRCGHTLVRRRPVGTYQHTCSVCQFSKRAKRRMSSWRCPECVELGLDGRLKIERIDER